MIRVILIKFNINTYNTNYYHSNDRVTVNNIDISLCNTLYWMLDPTHVSITVSSCSIRLDWSIFG